MKRPASPNKLLTRFYGLDGLGAQCMHRPHKRKVARRSFVSSTFARLLHFTVPCVISCFEHDRILSLRSSRVEHPLIRLTGSSVEVCNSSDDHRVAEKRSEMVALTSSQFTQKDISDVQ
jgi:hypothetical protein